MNDIKLQSSNGKHPVDENLRPLYVGDKQSAIETAQHGNGAKINGGLEVTGEMGTIKADQIEFSDDIKLKGGDGLKLYRDEEPSFVITTTASSTAISMREAPGGADLVNMTCQTSGRLVISTIDVAGSEADLILQVDGYVDI